MNQNWHYIFPKKTMASDISQGQGVGGHEICYKSYQMHFNTTYLKLISAIGGSC